MDALYELVQKRKISSTWEVSLILIILTAESSKF